MNNFDVSDEGWDNEMICYPFIFEHKKHFICCIMETDMEKQVLDLAVMEEKVIVQPVVIIGNSITAEVVYDLIKKDERYKVECFAVDKQYINELKIS